MDAMQFTNKVLSFHKQGIPSKQIGVALGVTTDEVDSVLFEKFIGSPDVTVSLSKHLAEYLLGGMGNENG